MRNLVFWIFIAIFLAASATTAIHLRSLRDSTEHLDRIQPLYERMPVFPELRLSMEKYRRASGNFRKMYNVEIAANKTRVKNEISQSLSKLAALAPTDEDQATEKSIQEQLDTLLRLSAKYEPQLFLKDAYQKPDVEEAHDAILKGIDDLEASTQRRLDAERERSSSDGSRSLRLILAADATILALVLLMIVRTYVIHVRPTFKLAEFARKIVSDGDRPDIPKHLPPLQTEIAGVMASLASQAEQLRDQRRKFIEDVIDDLRPGLAALRRSEDVEGATSILSASLEDLKQLSEISRMDQRVNFGVVDLSELLTDTCKRASRSGLCPEIRVSVPELPTWVRMDGDKMSRAMIQILAKMGEALEKGQTIEAILQVRGKSGLNGVEIAFHSSGAKIASAPEQEIHRHWISQRGLALTLAQKVAKAHEGSIFASGLTGSPVQISIKFPKSILTDGLVSPARYSASKTIEVDNFNV